MISKLNKLIKTFSTLQKATQSGTVQKREYLQFSKAKLTDFGDLPQGVIPEALQYDLPFELTTLSNGVKVATEQSQSSLASVQVLIKSGTRQESLETSGVCQFLQKLNFAGTATKSKEQIQQEIDFFGGNICVQTSRETTKYTLSFEPQHLDRAVNFLGEILLNSVYNKNQVEAEREAIHLNCLENTKDQKNATLEAVHYTSYRDHYISQPVHGIRENIANITDEHIKTYHQTNYVGKNFVVAASGPLAHEQLVKAVQNSFGKLASDSSLTRLNTEKPYFTPSTLYMRDDEMHNINIGVFFEAPNYTDPDYFGMQVFKNIMGEYRADKYTGAHLNNADRQYSLMHTELGGMPDVTLHKCDYLPYSDCGLFGNYLYGNEVFATQMLYLSQMILTEYASYLNPVELFRAKNKIYNDLLTEKNSGYTVCDLADQVAYLGRRVPRSEYAQRVAHYDTGLLNRVATRWFWDKEISVVTWGPIHHLMAFSHYNRPIRRSTLGWYGSQQYKIL